MTRLILLRHGESEANRAGLFAGWSDYPLTPLGHAQAESAAKYIAENYHIACAYTSDLLRASQTGEHVSTRFGLPLVREKGLREIYAGEWEGQSFDALCANYGEAYRTFREDIGNAHCTGGESFTELQARVVATVQRIAAEHPGQDILIATHATVVRALVCFMRGIAPSEAHGLPWVPNASVSVAERDGRGTWSVPVYGYHAYLRDLATEVPPNV